MSELLPEKEQQTESKAEVAFQMFCASVFLGMIGLVFYNAMLRYVFRSSFAPSEEWARILFMYITFFGSIEGFYRHRHIAVDMFTSMMHGATRKAVDIVAQLLALFALFVLAVGGISLVEQTIDTKTVLEFEVISDTKIAALIPAAVSGASDVVVTNASGASSAFAYTAAGA